MRLQITTYTVKNTTSAVFTGFLRHLSGPPGSCPIADQSNQSIGPAYVRPVSYWTAFIIQWNKMATSIVNTTSRDVELVDRQ